MSEHVFLTERTTFGGETAAGRLRNQCAFTSRDMAGDWPEAFTWAVVYGWGPDPDEPGDEGAMDEVAAKYGWDDDLIAFLNDAHARFKQLDDRTPAAQSESAPTPESKDAADE